jgi:hypothetical protein
VRQMGDSIRAHGGTLWYAESSTTGHGLPNSPHEAAYVVGALLEFLDRVVGS